MSLISANEWQTYTASGTGTGSVTIPLSINTNKSYILYFFSNAQELQLASNAIRSGICCNVIEMSDKISNNQAKITYDTENITRTYNYIRTQSNLQISGSIPFASEATYTFCYAEFEGDAV